MTSFSLLCFNTLLVAVGILDIFRISYLEYCEPFQHCCLSTNIWFLSQPLNNQAIHKSGSSRAIQISSFLLSFAREFSV